jgi:stalled ribosome alternative rescue factor ArfA
MQKTENKIEKTMKGKGNFLEKDLFKLNQRHCFKRSFRPNAVEEKVPSKQGN